MSEIEQFKSKLRKGFIAWVDAELYARRWTFKDLNDHASMVASALSNIRNGRSDVTLELIKGLSDIFEEPLEVSLRKIGVFDPGLGNEVLNKLSADLAAFSDDDLADVVSFVEWKKYQIRKRSEVHPSEA